MSHRTSRCSITFLRRSPPIILKQPPLQLSAQIANMYSTEIATKQLAERGTPARLYERDRHSEWLTNEPHLHVEEREKQVPHCERTGVGLRVATHNVRVGVVASVRKPPRLGETKHHERGEFVPSVWSETANARVLREPCTPSALPMLILVFAACVFAGCGCM